MGKTMTLVKEEQATERGYTRRETVITKDIVFRGKDECGRSGWFVRLTASGLYPRRVGPFPTKDEALEVLEEFIGGVLEEPFINLQNDMQGHRAYVVESVPALQGR